MRNIYKNKRFPTYMMILLTNLSDRKFTYKLTENDISCTSHDEVYTYM